MRGEVVHVVRRVQQAVADAYAAGYIGLDILNPATTWTSWCTPARGPTSAVRKPRCWTRSRATAGLPRLKPPFPAVAGLYASPTVINNVESIASVPSIVANGASWFADLGTEKSKGYGIFSLSGHVTTPGQYEAPLGITLRELLDLAGGIRAGHRLKFWTPAARPCRC